MADLTEQIKITGGEAITATFNDIARAGEQAFQRIDQAASKLNIDSSVRNIEVAAKRAGVSFQEMEQRVRNASQTIGTITPALSTAGNAVRALEQETARTTNSLGAFATALRQIGRATGERELGRLSAVVRLLGNNIGGIVVAGAVVGLAAIAQSAAKAAETILSAASAANLSTDAFQRFAAIGTQTGLSLESMGTAASKTVDALKKSNAETEKFAEHVQDSRRAIQEARDAAGDLSGGFNELNRQSNAILTSFRNLGLTGKALSASWEEDRQAQAALEVQSRALSKSISDSDQAIRQQERALRRATIAAAEHATANQKLGIVLKNNDGTEKDALQIRREQAEAFKQLPKGIDGSTAALNRSRIANELWGDEARKISAAAAEGAAGIDKLAAAGERLVPKMTEAQLAIGDKFTFALNNLGTVLDDTKNKFGLAISPIFTQFLTTITELLIAARPSIISLGETLANVLGPALTGVGEALKLVGEVISLIGQAFTSLANLINQAFGTKLTGADVFVAALAAVLVAIGPLSVAIGILVVALAGLISKLNEASPIIKGGILIAIGLLIIAFGPVSLAIGVIGIAIAGLIVAFEKAWPAIKQGAQDFAAYIESTWVGSIIRGIGKAIDKVKELIAWFKSLGSTKQEASAGGDVGSDPDQGFAAGGQVHGKPGRDKIPAWLTNREFVHKTAAVDYYGVRFMHAINRMLIPREAFRGFNLGGLVSIPTQAPLRFANGGQATGSAGLRPLSLTIGADTFAGLLAPEAVAQRLIKVATARATHSAGRKPSGYGG